MLLTIEPKYLKALSYAMAAKDVRYYLLGVGIDATEGATFWLAADGHRIGVYHGAPSEEGRGACILPRSFVLSVLKMGDRVTKAHQFHIDFTAQTVTHVASGLTDKLIDGRYPDWRRVMPADLSGMPAQFDPDYMGGLAKIARALGYKASSVRTGYNGKSVALFTVGNEPDFIVGLMPMCQDAACVPDWLAPKTEETAPTEAA